MSWRLLELPQRVSSTRSRLKGESWISLETPHGKGPHLLLRGESPGFLQLHQRTWGSYRVTTGTSRTRSWGLTKVQSPSELRGASRFLCSHCHGRVPHMELRLEPQDSFPVLTRILGFLWVSHQGVRPRLVWSRVSQFSSRAEKAVSVFQSRLT